MSPQTHVTIGAQIPKALHRALRRIADKNGRSLTKQVVWVLERYIAEESS